MSNVEKFEKLLLSDEGIQAKVRAATDAYEGDKADERAFFDATVAAVAAEAGLPFTFDEAMEFAASGTDLNDSELEAVAGGRVGCFGIGYGDTPGPEGCSSERAGGGVCGGIGLGGAVWE